MGYKEELAHYMATEYVGLVRKEQIQIVQWLKEKGHPGWASFFRGLDYESRLLGRYIAGGRQRMNAVERLKHMEIAQRLEAMRAQEAAEEEIAEMSEPVQEVIKKVPLDPSHPDYKAYNTAASRKDVIDYIFSEGRYAKPKDE